MVGVLCDVLVHLGFQRRHQHPTGALAHQRIQVKLERILFRLFRSNYAQHAAYLFVDGPQPSGCNTVAVLGGRYMIGVSAEHRGPAKATAGDQQNGAKLFAGKGQCAGCHVLAAAGSHGTTGPNLDDAFAADRTQGFKQSTIQNVVLDQIRQASAPMPKNLVTGQDAQDVAAYVAAVAGKPGAAPPPAGCGSGTPRCHGTPDRTGA